MAPAAKIPESVLISVSRVFNLRELASVLTQFHVCCKAHYLNTEYMILHENTEVVVP